MDSVNDDNNTVLTGTRTTSTSTTVSSPITLYSHIPTVDIDPEGVYKYILIRLSKHPHERYLVRGYEWASYHDDIFQYTKQQIIQESKEQFDKDIVISCAGGGRIQRIINNDTQIKLTADAELPQNIKSYSNLDASTSSSSTPSTTSSTVQQNTNNDKILVYGYSVGYGRADHKRTVQLLQSAFPFSNISYSDEGY